MERRELLKVIGAGSLASLLPSIPAFSTEPASLLKRKRSLRIAHITDIHMQPERDAPAKFASCLHHIQNQPDKPDIIFSGGDTIMDALAQDRARVDKQWNEWHAVIRNDCSLQIEYCIGNHDVWGLDKAQSEPEYGKKYAVDTMRISNRYRSFDRNGWHFIVLDSTHVRDDGKWYTAKLDEEQRVWLEQDLNAVKPETPIFVMSHIPIMAACVFVFGENVKNQRWDVPGAWMHIDMVDITKLFYKYPNVKACISGHMHLLDMVTYNNVQYFCNGAVCGAWWKEEMYHETKAGYAIMNLYDDGTVEREYYSYS
jgi:3',5'-cyclic-AMP phosphodiesterase